MELSDKTTCEELQLHLFVYQCPPVMLIDQATGQIRNYEINYYVSGSAEKATAILFSQLSGGPINPCAVMQHINLQVLEGLRENVPEVEKRAVEAVEVSHSNPPTSELF